MHPSLDHMSGELKRGAALREMWTAGCCLALAFSAPPALRTPARQRRAVTPRAALDAQDELKSRFSRGEASETKTSFTPDRDPVTNTAVVDAEKGEKLTANQQLLAEIRALQPEPVAPPPEKKAIDLNGIQPAFLLLGAGSYGVFSVLAWQFTQAAGAYFAMHPMDDAFYVVARLSGVARYVVVGMGGLGAGVTCIAALGQLALAVQVQMGIMKGELDPNKQRVDPYGGRKQGELEKMLGLMLGDKEAGNGNKL